MTVKSAVRRLSSIAVIAFITLAALSVSTGVRAQQGGDLSSQLQLFQTLPPEQQQSLMQRFGQGGQSGLGLSSGGLSGLSGLGSLGGSGGLGVSNSQSLLLQQMQIQQQRRLLSKAQNSSSGQNAGYGFDQELPVFKAGDTVLVELSLLAETNKQTPGTQPATAAAPVAPQPATQQQYNQQAALGIAGQNTLRVQEQPQRTVEELQAEEKQRLQEMIEHIRLRNPYVVDRNGEINLPGIPAIAIAGLNEELATRRVAAELAFEKIQITLTRLPVEKSGKEALKPFGYDLFENSSLALLPMLNQPVPNDYTVGPGDSLQVQLYGTTNQTLRLTVARNGQISLPQIGPIEVAGQRYGAMQEDIEDRVSRQIIGTHATVTMGELRTINVFVIGSANFPGSYTISSLSTVTTALFAAGGVLPAGSLRSIQVKRQGEIARTFDLYDLLMRGNSSNDIQLQAGDVVFIPPIGPTAAIDGEVQRPAIFELKGSQTIDDLIHMGGGLNSDADAEQASLVRVNADQRRVVLNVNPSSVSAVTLLRNGDLLQIARLRPQLDSGVTIQGHVYHEKYVAWHEGLRLSDAISSSDDVMEDSDQHYLLIRRESPPNRHISVLSADLAAALRSHGSSADVVLMPRDQITVLDNRTDRGWVIASLMNDLRAQSSLGEPTEIVHVDGQVKIPGEYPLEQGMHVSDLLRAGGGLDPNAYEARAELARYSVQNGDQRETQVINIDLAAVRNGDRGADIVLQPFDRLSVKQISGWTGQDQVQLKGEVRFPGTYAIRPGETLQSVISRAGGPTEFAFLDGSLFTRTELKIREQEQLDRLAMRMRTEIAEVALMGVRAQQGSAPSAISVGESLLHQLSDAKAVGRLVIDLRTVMSAKPGSGDDVILRNGDQLIIPKQRQEVMVLGEVQDPTSHLYKRTMSRDDYIDQSGGPTRQADKSRIYVVRANGSVDSGNRGWFHDSDTVQIRPGDAIVVPLDTERLPPLTLYTAVTTILYNIAIAAAEARSTF